MAIDHEIIRRNPFVQQAINRLPGSFDECDLLDMISVLRSLDELTGVAQPDDRVVVVLEVGMDLLRFTRVMSPQPLVEAQQEILKSLIEGDNYRTPDDHRMTGMKERVEKAVFNWFDVCFDLNDPETGKPIEYPENLRGKTVKVRLIERIDGDVPFAYATVRANGTPIQINARHEDLAWAAFDGHCRS